MTANHAAHRHPQERARPVAGRARRGARCARSHPGLFVELVPMSTRGDEILDRPLATIGGKGLFLKELEVAMLEDRADIAVHSLKDVPTELEPGFALGAILPRADAADAFISNDYARPRRIAARARAWAPRRCVARRSCVPCGPIWNCSTCAATSNTRLAKLDAGHYDAIILACAGLERLGLGHAHPRAPRRPDWLPAPGRARSPSSRAPAIAASLELLARAGRCQTQTAVDAPSAP